MATCTKTITARGSHIRQKLDVMYLEALSQLNVLCKLQSYLLPEAIWGPSPTGLSCGVTSRDCRTRMAALSKHEILRSALTRIHIINTTFRLPRSAALFLKPVSRGLHSTTLISQHNHFNGNPDQKDANLDQQIKLGGEPPPPRQHFKCMPVQCIASLRLCGMETLIHGLGVVIQ